MKVFRTDGSHKHFYALARRKSG